MEESMVHSVGSYSPSASALVGSSPTYNTMDKRKVYILLLAVFLKIFCFALIVTVIIILWIFWVERKNKKK